MFGYPTNDDYYHAASPVHTLKSVQVPMLCLNAADDVFSPSHGEPKTGPTDGQSMSFSREGRRGEEPGPPGKFSLLTMHNFAGLKKVAAVVEVVQSVIPIRYLFMSKKGFPSDFRS